MYSNWFAGPFFGYINDIPPPLNLLNICVSFYIKFLHFINNFCHYNKTLQGCYQANETSINKSYLSAAEVMETAEVNGL